MDQPKYLNMNELDPNRVVNFIKWVPDSDSEENMVRLYQKIGMLPLTNNDNNMYHKYCGFNKFTEKLFSIPTKENGWLSLLEQMLEEFNENNENDETLEDFFKHFYENFRKRVLSTMCNPNVSEFTNDKRIMFDDIYVGWKCYSTLDNYSIGFVVPINELKNKAHIYGRTPRIISDSDDDDDNTDDKKFFNKLISEYEPIEIFIGKSKVNEMTTFSGGYGDKWNGNSILLRINPLNQNDDKFHYVHIGTVVFEFMTDEKIIKYVSSVGNNCVPYPYAESENWCYCMSEQCKTPIGQHPNRKNVGNISFINNVEYTPIDNLKIIAERDSLVCKYAASAKKKTNCFRFLEPVEMKLMENTCAYQSLPAVQNLESRQ